MNQPYVLAGSIEPCTEITPIIEQLGSSRFRFGTRFRLPDGTLTAALTHEGPTINYFAATTVVLPRILRPWLPLDELWVDRSPGRVWR